MTTKSTHRKLDWADKDMMAASRSQVNMVNGHVVWTSEDLARHHHFKITTHFIVRNWLHRVLLIGKEDLRLSLLKTMRPCPKNRLKGGPQFSAFSMVITREWWLLCPLPNTDNLADR